MDVKKDEILNRFISEIKDYFKDRLKNVLLFGSRARGDFSPESDYDCILLLDKVFSGDEEFVNKLESKVLLENYVLFSTFLMPEMEFKEKKYEPFLMNARKEGVFL